jgi:hypothetical protein
VHSAAEDHGLRKLVALVTGEHIHFAAEQSDRADRQQYERGHISQRNGVNCNAAEGAHGGVLQARATS